MTTHPLNLAQSQNKNPGVGTRDEKPSRRRKYTPATTLAAIKSTEKVAISKRIFVRTQESARSSVIGPAARKSSLAPTNSLAITVLTPAKNVMCVQYVASALWEATIFRSTRKRTDWSRGKSSTGLRTQCSFEAKRVDCACIGTWNATFGRSREIAIDAIACNLKVSDLESWSVFQRGNDRIGNTTTGGHFTELNIDHELLLS